MNIKDKIYVKKYLKNMNKKLIKVKGTKNPINIIKTAIYRIKQKKEIFPYYGIRAYMGMFGSGKTLSAVRETKEILETYQEATFITNTSIAGIRNKTLYFGNSDELIEILLNTIELENTKGYIVFIDEIHVVFKDIFNKSGDNDFITFLSQLRKIGMYIIGTAQIFSRCPKVVREYLLTNGNIVLCDKILPGITILKYVDMTTAEETSKNRLESKIQKTEVFIHTVELYESYNTKAVVTQIKAMIRKGEKNGLPRNI